MKKKTKRKTKHRKLTKKEIHRYSKGQIQITGDIYLGVYHDAKNNNGGFAYSIYKKALQLQVHKQACRNSTNTQIILRGLLCVLRQLLPGSTVTIYVPDENVAASMTLSALRALNDNDGKTETGTLTPDYESWKQILELWEKNNLNITTVTKGVNRGLRKHVQNLARNTWNKEFVRNVIITNAPKQKASLYSHFSKKAVGDALRQAVEMAAIRLSLGSEGHLIDEAMAPLKAQACISSKELRLIESQLTELASGFTPSCRQDGSIHTVGGRQQSGPKSQAQSQP